MDKSPDAFRTISEVADWLGVQAHVLRFWESKFTQVKPVKRAGGRRYYRPADMALLGGIKVLLHEDGMTIKGVQKMLRELGVDHVAGRSADIEGAGAASPEASAAQDNVVPLDRNARSAPTREAEPAPKRDALAPDAEDETAGTAPPALSGDGPAEYSRPPDADPEAETETEAETATEALMEMALDPAVPPEPAPAPPPIDAAAEEVTRAAPLPATSSSQTEEAPEGEDLPLLPSFAAKRRSARSRPAPPPLPSPAPQVTTETPPVSAPRPKVVEVNDPPEDIGTLPAQPAALDALGRVGVLSPAAALELAPLIEALRRARPPRAQSEF